MVDFCRVIRSNLHLNFLSVYFEIKAVASSELLLTPENQRNVSYMLFPLPSCISFRDSFAWSLQNSLFPQPHRAVSSSSFPSLLVLFHRVCSLSPQGKEGVPFLLLVPNFRSPSSECWHIGGQPYLSVDWAKFQFAYYPRITFNSLPSHPQKCSSLSNKPHGLSANLSPPWWGLSPPRPSLRSPRCSLFR